MIVTENQTCINNSDMIPACQDYNVWVKTLFNSQLEDFSLWCETN